MYCTFCDCKFKEDYQHCPECGSELIGLGNAASSVSYLDFSDNFQAYVKYGYNKDAKTLFLNLVLYYFIVKIVVLFFGSFAMFMMSSLWLFIPMILGIIHYKLYIGLKEINYWTRIITILISAILGTYYLYNIQIIFALPEIFVFYTLVFHQETVDKFIANKPNNIFDFKNIRIKKSKQDVIENEGIKFNNKEKIKYMEAKSNSNNYRY